MDPFIRVGAWIAIVYVAVQLFGCTFCVANELVAKAAPSTGTSPLLNVYVQTPTR